MFRLVLVRALPGRRRSPGAIAPDGNNPEQQKNARDDRINTGLEIVSLDQPEEMQNAKRENRVNQLVQ